MENVAAGLGPVKIDHARGHDPAWPSPEDPGEERL